MLESISARGIEVWSGSAAPRELIRWTLELTGHVDTYRELYVAVYDAEARQTSLALYASRPYGFRSGFGVTGVTPREMLRAEGDSLLAREENPERVTLAELRDTSAYLRWRASSSWQEPVWTTARITVGTREEYEFRYCLRSPIEAMLNALPRDHRRLYSTSCRVAMRLAREGHDDLSRTGLRFAPAAYLVELPYELSCRWDMALPADKRHLEFAVCVARQVEWYRSRGLVLD